MFPGLECHSSGLSKESLLFSGFPSQSSPPNRASKCGSALAATFINWWFMLIKRVTQENGIVCFDISFCSVIMIQGYIRSYTIIILSWDRHCTCHIFKSRHCHVNPGALRGGAVQSASASLPNVCASLPHFYTGSCSERRHCDHSGFIESDRIRRRVGI